MKANGTSLGGKRVIGNQFVTRSLYSNRTGQICSSVTTIPVAQWRTAKVSRVSGRNTWLIVIPFAMGSSPESPRSS